MHRVKLLAVTPGDVVAIRRIMKSYEKYFEGYDMKKDGSVYLVYSFEDENVLSYIKKYWKLDTLS